jgi:hypothetical protein
VVFALLEGRSRRLVGGIEGLDRQLGQDPSYDRVTAS